MPRLQTLIAPTLTLALLALLSMAASACSIGMIPTEVPTTFSVHVYNEIGPVEGLQLKLIFPEGSETVVEATTDKEGIAIFHAPFVGKFYIVPAHHVTEWGGVVDVKREATTSRVELEWPAKVLHSAHFRGQIQIEDFSDTSRVLPLRAILSVRRYLSYEEVATTMSDEKGRFAFNTIDPGFYFLEVNGKYKDNPNVPQGDIAIYIDAGAASDNLRIITAYSSCGLSYRAQEKSRAQ